MGGQWSKVARRAALLWLLYNMYQSYRMLRRRERRVEAAASSPGEPVMTHRIVTRADYAGQLEAAAGSDWANVKAGVLEKSPPRMQRILAESCSFIGGPAAVMLQTAHPYIGVAVTRESNYKFHIHERFRKTFLYVFQIGLPILFFTRSMLRHTKMH